MVRLDDVAPADTAMIKIDVEGYEAEVLAGAARLLRQSRPYVLAELATEPDKAEATIAAVRGAGHRAYWFVDPFVTPQAPKAPWQGKRRGDLHVFGVPAEVEQPRDMTEIRPGEPHPESLAGYPYLKAFGFRIP
ncbi:MAG: hypothetical protein DI570_22065 [Phenylobacterium zucineum]|nr:MAG: hypothetical protein DI570_22065 [Phenylobacterium zucineum]